MPTTITKEIFIDINDFKDWIDVEIDLDETDIREIAGYLGLSVSKDEDDIMDLADHYGLLVFRNEKEIISYIEKTEVEDIILEDIVKKAVKSPYYKEKLLQNLKDWGLL